MTQLEFEWLEQSDRVNGYWRTWKDRETLGYYRFYCSVVDYMARKRVSNPNEEFPVFQQYVDWFEKNVKNKVDT